MTTRAEQAAATRAGILAAVHALHREGAFRDATMDTIASRAGVTRVTLYRAFGSKRELLAAMAWDLLARARLDRVDEAHTEKDPRAAVREVLRANCELFAGLGDAMPVALELVRSDAAMSDLVAATYHGRRHRSMEALAGRLVRAEASRPGWTTGQITDALLVLSSYEAYETLVQHRRATPDEAAALLDHLAGGFCALNP